MAGMKQVIAVRTDLGMGRGKIAAQVGHACVMGCERAGRSRPEWLEEWRRSGQAKVVVRAGDAREAREIVKGAALLGIPWCEVADAGLTQLEPGTLTCVSLGPAPAEVVDRVTGGLRLL